MSSIIIIGITILILLLAYTGYARWLAGRLGINPQALTAARKLEDNKDYVPVKASVLSGHANSALSGPLLIQGTIVSAVFGWVPVVVWLVLAGVLLGATQNLSVLFVSLRNGGKSLGKIIEEQLGKRTGKLLFMMAWIMVIILMAFFMDMALQLLDGYYTGAQGAEIQNGYHASVSMALLLMLPISIIFGYLNRLGCPVIISTILALILMVASLGASIYAPFYIKENIWLYILLGCSLAAAILPVWFLVQPLGYLSGYYFYGILLAVMAGVFITQPQMKLEAVGTWKTGGQYLFPQMFAILSMCVFSGYHGMFTSTVSSRTLDSEKKVRKAAYGPLLFQILAGVVILVVTGTLASGSELARMGSPVEIYQAALWNLAQQAGVKEEWQIAAEILILLSVAVLAFGAAITASRVGRILLQELTGMGNKILPGIFTAAAAGGLVWLGYEYLWPVAEEYILLLIVPMAIGCMAWMKELGGKYKFLIAPAIVAVILSLPQGILLVMDDMRVLAAHGFERSTIPEILRMTLIIAGMLVSYLAVIDGGRAFMKRKKIVFATGNEGKLREIRKIMSDLPVEISSMKEAGIQMDIDENGTTFEENAIIKAKAVAQEAGCIVLADDSGLEVDYLNKEPGVQSARYMGEDTSYTIKNAKIIERLSEADEEQRTARFVCVIAAVFPDGRVITTRGTMEGRIGHEPQGENGFGYDPIFYPDGYECSSAELDMEEKNKISHRGKALRAMRDKLV